MVKIGRAPKNYGLTKVQARKVAKENDGVLQPLAIAETRNHVLNNDELHEPLNTSGRYQNMVSRVENF